MTKLILCIAIIVLCGFVGYGFSNYYLQRKKFFLSMSNFLMSLKTDIGFNAKSLNQIIKDNINQAGTNKTFKNMLENFLISIENNNRFCIDDLFKNISILSTEEKESIYHFFKKLGKSDINSQLQDIEKLYAVNGKYLDNAKDDSKKYCSLYLKLGIIIGAFVALVIA